MRAHWEGVLGPSRWLISSGPVSFSFVPDEVNQRQFMQCPTSILLAL
jgi:hypothetical protein